MDVSRITRHWNTYRLLRLNRYKHRPVALTNLSNLSANRVNLATFELKIYGSSASSSTVSRSAVQILVGVSWPPRGLGSDANTAILAPRRACLTLRRGSKPNTRLDDIIGLGRYIEILLSLAIYKL